MYEYSILIGRFQPFHLVHQELLKRALKIAKKTIIVIGSHAAAPNPKNPFTSEQREKIISLTLSEEELKKVQFIYLQDHIYNENLWLMELQNKVEEIVNGEENVVLLGNHSDASSYYLDLFPQYKLIKHNPDTLCPHATQIRYLYFTHDVEYKKYLHPKVVEYLEEFKKSQQFLSLKEEFDFLRDYTLLWKDSPYPVSFQTADSVCIRSGHVLLVKRKFSPGKGLYAFPGGFVQQNETLRTAAIRELKEETGIAISKQELNNSIVEHKVYDDPHRSLRGRTITSAFLLNLGTGTLPKIKAADDADSARWVPLNEALSMSWNFFEDHYHILVDLVSKF